MKQQDIELRSVIAIFSRQARVIMITVGIVFGLSSIFMLTATPKYSATSLILINPKPKDLLQPSQSQMSGQANENAMVDSEVEILRSSAVSLAVIENEGLIQDPEFGPKLATTKILARAVGIANASTDSGEMLLSKTLVQFQDATTVRRKGLTYVIAVSVSSKYPDRAADLANALARTYIDQQLQTKVADLIIARDILQSHINAARAQLSVSEQQFDVFVEKNIDRIGAASGNIKISNLSATLANSETEIAFRRRVLGELQSQLNTRSWDQLTQNLADQAVQKLETEHRILSEKLKSGTLAANENINIAEQIKRLENQLLTVSNKKIAGLKDDIQSLENGTKSLRQEIRSEVLTTELPPDLLTEIYAVQQDANIARTQYQNLLLRLRDIDTQSNIQIADSRMVSPALAPITPSFPNKNLILLATLAASIGFGVGVAFLNEYYIGGVTSEKQLSELMNATVSTVIPMVPDTNDRQQSIADNIVDLPISTYSESIRKLRAGIDQLLRNDLTPNSPSLGKILLTTSAVSDEGKTTTSLALARTYALSGKKTLLIDADLRLPAIHQHIGIQPSVGILDFLSNPTDTEVSSGFYARDPLSPLVLMMGAGNSELPTDQLLNSETFNALLKQAQEVYDIIVIDSPPMLPVVDTRYIAHNADAVVFTVKWANTSQTELRSAHQILQSTVMPNTPILPALTYHQASQRGIWNASPLERYSAAS